MTQAVDTIELFTKTEGEFQSTLFDMQCMWYELDRAESHERQGEWGPALKQFLAVESHMKDINEDQFDFHTYCIRKVTLRAYLQMIRLQDHLTAHPFYQRAMRGAVRIYLRLVDNPLPPPTPEELAADEAEELKKKEEKAAKAAAEKKKGKSAPKGEDEQAKKDEDDDPVGKKHLKVDALEAAAKYSKLLLESPLGSAKDQLQGQMLAYEVAMRQGKELLALQVRPRRARCACCGAAFRRYACLPRSLSLSLSLRSAHARRLLLLLFPPPPAGAEARHRGVRLNRTPGGAPAPRRAPCSRGVARHRLAPPRGARASLRRGDCGARHYAERGGIRAGVHCARRGRPRAHARGRARAGEARRRRARRRREREVARGDGVDRAREQRGLLLRRALSAARVLRRGARLHRRELERRGKVRSFHFFCLLCFLQFLFFFALLYSFVCSSILLFAHFSCSHLETHLALCHERFPLATLFASDAEKVEVYAEHVGAVTLARTAEEIEVDDGAAAAQE